MEKKLTGPDGTPITVRPIERKDLERMVLRCWPDPKTIDMLFAGQGTIGMAAWEGEKSVGMLHCYRITLPGGTEWDPHWGGNWWTGDEDNIYGKGVFTEELHWGPGKVEVGVEGALWCHACCHVGRTIEMAAKSDDPDPRYAGRGIATALCKASVQWAREHGYAGVLAAGAPDGLFELAVWSGHIPWTTYARLGFEVVPSGDDPAVLPKWAEGDSPPEVMAQVREALAEGRPVSEIRQRLMLLNLAGNRQTG